MTQIGCGTGYSVKVEGDFLYISGELEKATSVTTTPAPTGGQGACALTGKYGGYLAKISKADGKCVWAKDTPKHHCAVSDGTSVWAASEGEAPLIYDASHSVAPNSAERDIFVAKYSAADGTGHWAAAVGGIGEEGLSDLAMTSNGPMIMGSSDSPSFTMGSVEVHNLQHDFLGKKETEGAGHDRCHHHHRGQHLLRRQCVHRKRGTLSQTGVLQVRSQQEPVAADGPNHRPW